MWGWLKKAGSGLKKVGGIALTLETITEPYWIGFAPPGAQFAINTIKGIVGKMETKLSSVPKSGASKKEGALELAQPALIGAIQIMNATVRKSNPITEEQANNLIALQAAAIDGVVQEANGVKAQIAYVKAWADIFGEDKKGIEAVESGNPATAPAA